MPKMLIQVHHPGEEGRGLLVCHFCGKWMEDFGNEWPCINCGSVTVMSPTDLEMDFFCAWAGGEHECWALDPFPGDWLMM